VQSQSDYWCVAGHLLTNALPDDSSALRRPLQCDSGEKKQCVEGCREDKDCGTLRSCAIAHLAAILPAIHDTGKAGVEMPSAAYRARSRPVVGDGISRGSVG